MTLHSPYDVIVIGGSYAGMAAALQIARTRRRVLVIDAGRRRNRYAAHSHGFLGQDGRAPGAIADDAKAQLLRYPSVDWIEGSADAARAEGDGFEVRLGDGTRRHGRRLILAGGVVDILPEVPGLRERWGRSVFLCPYCDGFELELGRIGVLAVNPHAFHQAMLLADWGQVTLFTNGVCELEAEQAAALAARGIGIETTRVRAIGGPIQDKAGAGVELEDGRVLMLAGLFTATRTEHPSPIAAELGCAFEDGMLGPIIQTDAWKQTSVPGVFACGDAARAMASVSLAVGDGSLAGVAAHKSLVFP